MEKQESNKAIDVSKYITYDTELGLWITFDETYDVHSTHPTEAEAIAEITRYTHWLQSGVYL